MLKLNPEPGASDKITNIRQSMLKLSSHSGLHDLFLKYIIKHVYR